MNNMLPIGSIVTLKEAGTNLMIIGYDCKKDNIVYDYVAVFHLAGKGYHSANRKEDLVVFNRKSIKEVNFIGYMDKNVRNKLKYLELMKNMKEGKK